MPERLPIYDLEDSILAAAQNLRRLIVSAPTGSGKSRQVPQMLVNAGLAGGQVVILQPIRLAARLLAAGVARERGGNGHCSKFTFR